MITALLLAAGQSRRFGAQKLLQELNGKPVIRWSAESLVGPPVDEIVVVVGAERPSIERALAGIAARFVTNDEAESRGGMASSLAAGVAALGADVTAALVALGDEPMAGRQPLEQVVARYRAGGAQIVVPRFQGVRGHPVLFDRAVFPELTALHGDHGARAVADREPGRRAFVDLDRPKPVDVDTPGDLARVRG